MRADFRFWPKAKLAAPDEPEVSFKSGCLKSENL
jgi:hypothetical protein